jgi:hypothetical protein
MGKDMKEQLFANSQLKKPVLDKCTATPSDDYDTLRRQFFAMRSQLNCKNAYLLSYQEKDYELALMNAQSNMETLESERAMNAQLTTENMMLSETVESSKEQIDNLKSVVASTRKRLATIEPDYACEMLDNMEVYSASEIDRVLSLLVERLKDFAN